MKKILQYLLAFWLFGGGFMISIVCLIISWKIALGVFCFWCCVWVIMVVYWCFEVKIIYLKEKDEAKKKKMHLRMEEQNAKNYQRN